MLYIVTISRFAFGFIFLYSFLSKLRDVAGFESTIKNFQLLSDSLHRPITFGFMMGEAIVVIAALIGGDWLFLCYGLGIGLLVLFIYALRSVLQRKIQTSCNCFGTSEQMVSQYDIWRNVAIVLVAIFGLISLVVYEQPYNVSILDGLLSGIVALVLSMLLLNLRELLELVM